MEASRPGLSASTAAAGGALQSTPDGWGAHAWRPQGSLRQYIGDGGPIVDQENAITVSRSSKMG